MIPNASHRTHQAMYRTSSSPLATESFREKTSECRGACKCSRTVSGLVPFSLSRSLNLKRLIRIRSCNEFGSSKAPERTMRNSGFPFEKRCRLVAIGGSLQVRQTFERRLINSGDQTAFRSKLNLDPKTSSHPDDRQA